MSRVSSLLVRAEPKCELQARWRGRGILRFLRQGIFILLCVAAVAQELTKPAPAPNSCPSSDDAAIRQIADEWRDGYNSGEASKVAALYADGASYLTQHFATGIVEGRKNIQAYVQRGIDAHYHIDSIEVLKVNCACSTPMPSLKARLRGSRAVRQCNFAYAIARYQSTNAGRKAVGVNLIVLRKFQNEWRIVAHEAAVPDPATAIQKLD